MDGALGGSIGFLYTMQTQSNNAQGVFYFQFGVDSLCKPADHLSPTQCKLAMTGKKISDFLN